MISHMADVVRYLDAMAFARSRQGAEWLPGHAPFVTISRQAGAGGHALADAVIRELARRDEGWAKGWQVFDRALIAMVDQDPRLRDTMRALLSEEYYSRGYDFVRQVLMGSVPQDLVVARVFHSVRLLAGIGKVIVVGRGSACLTRDLAGGVHVRLVSSRPARIARLQKDWNQPPEAVEKRMDEDEASRAALVRQHFHQDVTDPELYDAVWNVDRVSFTDIARWIAERLVVRAKKGQASVAPVG